MASRFFDDQQFEVGQPFELSESVSHHIGKVLRMSAGDRLVLFNGKEGEWQATVQEVRKKGVVVSIDGHDLAERTPPLPVRLLLPLLKPDRMDYALQKSVELGASQIQLVVTERTEGRVGAEKIEKKMQHFQQVIVSACEQCGLNRLPILHRPVKLSEALPHSTDQNTLRLIAHPGEKPLHYQAINSATAIDLLTGPEGGFSPSEIEQAQAEGFQGFALGERILRAETAPPVLLAALWAIRGFSGH